MAYFLQVKTDRGNYRTLNIDELDILKFAHISKTYKSPFAYSLQELDRFTMEFDNIEELKKYLIEKNVLPINMINQPLMIRFIQKGKSVSNYNLLFKDDFIYFYKPKVIIDFITKKHYDCDFIFLNALAKHFHRLRQCNSTASELLNITQLAINTGNLDKSYWNVDSNGDNVSVRLVKLLMYKYDLSKNGDISYKEYFNWRTFHLLIDFINNYDSSQLEKGVRDENTKPKVKKKTPPPVDSNDGNDSFYQLNFGDLSNN